ncbi:MAG: hypothetical protein WC841_02840 [Candidatus Shapirobacteria bacterium]|jgi:CheY-like chemotaxis protein
MSLKETKKQVALFDDSPDIQASLGMLLDMNDYGVHPATSMSEALELIPQLPKLKVRFAIVDGNLSPGGWGDNRDGAEIVSKIQQNPYQTITIGYASRGDVPGADYQSPKNKGPINLLNTMRLAILPSSRAPR